MMKKLQKLGKALMLPVAALPICGILMGLGYAIAPGVMGVPGAATSGALYNIGFLLVKAGGALIDNMAWLFVIGVAVGLSDDRDGTSALATGRSGILADDDQPAEHGRCHHAHAGHRRRSGQDARVR